MARKPVSIGELATDVLDMVARSHLEKSAAVSYNRDTTVTTELGQCMQKMADRVRAEAEDRRISYQDLAQFRERYGV